MSPAAPACHCRQKLSRVQPPFFLSNSQGNEAKNTHCLSPEVKKHTDLKGIFSVDVVVHGQHGDVEAGQQNAAEDALLFLVCTGKQN